MHEPLRGFIGSDSGKDHPNRALAVALAAEVRRDGTSPRKSPELPGKPRLLLDTNVLRQLGTGACDPKGLLQFGREGGSIHLAEGTVVELLRQLDSGEVEWSQWEHVRELLAQIVDMEVPVIMGGRDALVAAGISSPEMISVMTTPATVEFMKRLDPIRIGRQFWLVLQLARDLDALRGSEITMKRSEQYEVVREIFRVEEAVRATRHHWGRYFDRLQSAAERERFVLSGRGDHATLIDSHTRLLGAKLDAGFVRSVPAASIRFDAALRVQCLLMGRALRQKERYNAHKNANDKFDHDLLTFLALPAAICTADEGIFNDLEASRSWQIKWVVRPEELKDKATRRALLEMSWPSV